MATKKGPDLEELVRAYFSSQGYFALRGATLHFEGSEVTDIDVWLYGRQGSGVRTRSIVDVKNKRSPKALERILWAKGLQSVLSCDQAVVATTDLDPQISRFARQQGVALLTKGFLDRLDLGAREGSRLAWEDLVKNIQTNPGAKQDGDWLRVVNSVKTSLVSVGGFSAFNQAAAAFKFFAFRVQARAFSVEQALRCAYLVASYSCIALDNAVSNLVYESEDRRYSAIVDGVRYGNDGDGRVQASMQSILEVISSRMQNGKAVAAQARGALNGAFESVRAEVVAEFYGKSIVGVNLFRVARELERRAHCREINDLSELSVEEKQALGVLCDFIGVSRAGLVTPRLDSESQKHVPREGSLDIAPGAVAGSSSSLESVSPESGAQKKLL